MTATRSRTRTATATERFTARGEPRLVGPGFHARVYEVVRLVPRGKVTTYGDVATMLGSPRVARQVGYALSALEKATQGVRPVPWHRVINAQGAISFKGDVVRATMQRKLLEREGVEFDERDRVAFGGLRFDYHKGRRAK